MEYIASIHWMPYLALAVTLIAFTVLRLLSRKLGWTPIILVALLLGVGVGIAFRSEGNDWLRWVDFIGSAYVQLLMLMVAPVIFLSIVSGFITLSGKANAGKVGLRSVFWLMLQAAAAIALSIAAGELTRIGSGAGSVFENLGGLDASTVSAYEGLHKPFDQVLLGLLPSNIGSDIVTSNVPAIIISGVAIAAAYLAVAKKQGEEKVLPFRRFVGIAQRKRDHEPQDRLQDPGRADRSYALRRAVPDRGVGEQAFEQLAQHAHAAHADGADLRRVHTAHAARGRPDHADSRQTEPHTLLPQILPGAGDRVHHAVERRSGAGHSSQK